jgi:transcriptional regulator with XRE-family HTH domain
MTQGAHMNFLDLLEAAKAKAGSYKAVAERLNVDPPKLSEWKKGRYKPTSEHVVLLAEIAQLPELETLVEVQREINHEQAMVWERLLRKMGQAAAKAGAAFLVLGVIFLGVAPENSQARQELTDKSSSANTCRNIYIVAS